MRGLFAKYAHTFIGLLICWIIILFFRFRWNCSCCYWIEFILISRTRMVWIFKNNCVVIYNLYDMLTILTEFLTLQQRSDSANNSYSPFDLQICTPQKLNKLSGHNMTELQKLVLRWVLWFNQLRMNELNRILFLIPGFLSHFCCSSQCLRSFRLGNFSEKHNHFLFSTIQLIRLLISVKILISPHISWSMRGFKSLLKRYIFPSTFSEWFILLVSIFQHLELRSR